MGELPQPVLDLWVVTLVNGDKPDRPPRGERKPGSGANETARSIIILASASLQIVTVTAVCAWIGHLLAVHSHHSWWTVVGVLFGVATGTSGMIMTAKSLMGDKP